MKKLISLICCFILAVVLVVFLPSSKYKSKLHTSADIKQIGKFNQTIEYMDEDIHDVFSMYYQGELVGYLNDKSKFDKHLVTLYNNEYRDIYSNSKLNYDEDIYITKTKTNYIYSNVDDRIIAWLDINDLYSLEATYISIIEDNNIKYGIYVKDEETYQEAMNTFISYFIDQKVLATLNQGATLPSLSNYGSRETGISITQRIVIAKKFAKKEEIMTTKEEVLEFLKYGDNEEREYYVVQQYDTLAGVGSKNHGLSAKQVMDINRDKISSVDQVLQEGEELCVTYFTSPINIVITKEVLKERPIYFASNFVEDSSLLEGLSEVRKTGENGSENVLYLEKWVNGVLLDGEVLSSTVTKESSNEVIAVGTMSLPDVGTGNYRYPVDNPSITCPWGCYFGHVGVDFINLYDPWGDIYAVDNGVVVENSYTYINGNYIIINHNNGYRSYYGHMRVPSELPVGTIVQKGDVIGHIGMTGYATGPHVHFHFDDGVEDHRMDACNGFIDCAGLY